MEIKKRKRRTFNEGDSDYINPEETKAELLKSKTRGQCTERLGEIYLILVNRVSGLPNFIAYDAETKDDMRSQGCIELVAYAHKNFKPELNTSVFSYLTQITYQAFVKVLKKNKLRWEFETRIASNDKEGNVMEKYGYLWDPEEPDVKHIFKAIGETKGYAPIVTEYTSSDVAKIQVSEKKKRILPKKAISARFVSHEECVAKMLEVGYGPGNKWYRYVTDNNLKQYPTCPNETYKTGLSVYKYMLKYVPSLVKRVGVPKSVVVVSEEACVELMKSIGMKRGGGKHWQEYLKKHNLNGTYPAEPFSRYGYGSRSEFNEKWFK
jgi:DNA-directed RNA polymerase specialized sigma subunit